MPKALILNMQLIKIFLASSNELKAERDKLQKEITWKNSIWEDKGIKLQLNIWEDMSAQMSVTGSQSEYNKYVKEADLFVLLAWSKVGMYTEEEFEQAFPLFKSTNKPFIFTYFKTPPPDNADESLELFKKKLGELKHFYATFTDSNDLWNQFNKELDRLEVDGFTENYRPENILTRKLILMLKDKDQPRKFLKDLRSVPKDLENWDAEVKPADLVKAQNILVDYCFVSVIGSQLRRLFAIGNDRKAALQTKINDYIRLCCKTYRISLQLANFLFISRLWDKKIQNPGLDTNKDIINTFFSSERPLDLPELRSVFQCLLDIFTTNGLELPVDKNELSNMDSFLNNESEFNVACSAIEKLDEMDKYNSKFETGHYQKAVVSLTTILSAFPFFSNYEMISLKKVEYQGGRNAAGRYLKDYNYLEKKDAEILTRYLSIEEEPHQPYSVLFNNGEKNINLFPFLLDYNALTGGDDFHIYLYECREDDVSLLYYSLNSEEQKSIYFKGAELDEVEMESEEKKNDVQQGIRLDQVIKQFEAAMNTLLETDFQFKPKTKIRKPSPFSR